MKKVYLIIMGFIQSLAVDKLLHALISFLICVMVACVLSKCGMGHDPVVYVSMAVTLAIGAMKEFADWAWKSGSPSVNDFLADFIGVALALLFVSMFIA